MARRNLTPELIFCLTAPIGVDVPTCTQRLSAALSAYGYDVKSVKLTDGLPEITGTIPPRFKTLEERYQFFISEANRLREHTTPDAMAIIGVSLICAERERISGAADSPPEKGVAYIIDQLKRPEEIETFRKIYGRQVFQISFHANVTERRRYLSQRMRDFEPSQTRSVGYDEAVSRLLKIDQSQDEVPSGQRLRDVFPLADVFIDASNSQRIEDSINRFVKVIFGNNFVSPTRDEYGMYTAKAASLRSIDLSRQVGAAITRDDGGIYILGCNDVPKPGGGIYWEGDLNDTREYSRGRDTNEDHKYRVLANVVHEMVRLKLMDEKFGAMAGREIISHIKDTYQVDLKKTLRLMEAVEYGRIVHAEMNAITEAARTGVPLQNTTMYCTTFPCHICAKHIIASGIQRVVYIEPYPKSYTEEFYNDDIILDRISNPDREKIYFEPFIGISPVRYREFFEKGDRKDVNGSRREWVKGHPSPFLQFDGANYFHAEIEVIQGLVADTYASGLVAPSSEPDVQDVDHSVA